MRLKKLEFLFIEKVDQYTGTWVVYKAKVLIKPEKRNIKIFKIIFQIFIIIITYCLTR
jgi:hypothetical protein